MPKMKNLPKVDLPLEKLTKYGKEKLSDKELLAIVLGSGIEGLNVLQLSQKILAAIEKSGSEKVSIDSLEKIKGLGRAKASRVVAVLELGRRLCSETSPEIVSAEDVWSLCAEIRTSKKEHLVAAYLDTQGRLIEKQLISIGTLNANLAHPREIFEPAVSLRSAGVIVAHNHPSGNLEPSQDDIEVTKRLRQAGKILDIPLVDHVIVSSKGWKRITIDT